MTAATPNRVFVLLGSNIDPESNLAASVSALGQFGRIVSVSRVWQTRAVGDPDQPDYLNAAILLETTQDAHVLKLVTLAGIENELGRVRDPGNKNAARTIDLDIGLFNRECLMIEHRTIPDPDILKRPFVATPLAELDPEYIHPVTGERLCEIAGRLGVDPETMFPRPDVDLTGVLH